MEAMLLYEHVCARSEQKCPLHDQSLTRETTSLSNGVHSFSPACQNLVAIGLVPNIKDDLQGEMHVIAATCAEFRGNQKCDSAKEMNSEGCDIGYYCYEDYLVIWCVEYVVEGNCELHNP